MKRRVVTRRTGYLCLLILFTCCFIHAPGVWGEDPPRIALKTTSSQKLSLTVGKSTILQSPEPVKRVSLVSPEIADAMVLTPNQIYLMGRAPGVTTLTLWGTDNNVTVIVDIDVSPDISRLKEVVHKLLPDEREIKITATHDHITLAGTVSSSASLSQVLSLAGPYAPLDQEKKPKIINLLEVAGVHQVMLEVRISEMSRSLLRRLGVNFNYISSSGASLGLGMLNKLTSLPAAGFPASGIRVADSVNAIFRFMDDGTTWTVFIDALKEEGLLKVLAEPTLITISGKTASFLAGGEIPIPVPQSTGGGGTTVTIEYKPFGIGLNFTPTVLGNKKIGMQVAPEVSDADYTNSFTAGGLIVPSFNTRRVSTAIELADGQSFAIAGLLKEDVREIVSKYPILGDIPILGSLFRSSSFKKNETELIVIVTAHLVKPLDMAKQTLPTDAYIEPDDYEFYLLGTLEGKKGVPKKGGFEGDFGHMPPR